MKGKSLLKYIFLFIVGGLLYMGFELIWRGYSHWTMGVVGGAALISVGLINKLFKWETPLVYQILIGAGVITILEFVAGCILNLWLHLGVWDYSSLPLNILGQICPQFVAIWLVLTAVAIFLDDYIRYWIFGEEKPHYIIFPKRKE
jgi:uncharacterized membrane protein